MAPQSDGLPLLSYVGMVWRRRILVLIISLGMAVPAYTVSAVQIPEYQARGQILLTQRQLDENLNVSEATLTDTQVNSQIAILTGPEVAERARQQGGTSPIRVAGTAGSNVLLLVAEDRDPRQAATTVEAYVRGYSEYRTQQVRKTLDNAAAQVGNRVASLKEQINKLPVADRASLQDQLVTVQGQLGRIQIQQGLVSSGIEVVQNPVADPAPISPTPVRNGLLALVLGLALGLSLAVLLETVRQRTNAAPATGQAHPTANPSSPARHDTRLTGQLDNGRPPAPSHATDDPA